MPSLICELWKIRLSGHVFGARFPKHPLKTMLIWLQIGMDSLDYKKLAEAIGAPNGQAARKRWVDIMRN
jgi:hypothetical protein